MNRHLKIQRKYVIHATRMTTESLAIEVQAEDYEEAEEVGQDIIDRELALGKYVTMKTVNVEIDVVEETGHWEA